MTLDAREDGGRSTSVAGRPLDPAREGREVAHAVHFYESDAALSAKLA